MISFLYDNMSKSSLEAAAEAAARVNAMLIAKGKLKLPPTQLKPKIGTTINIAGRGSGDLVTAEVEINDAPLTARNLLTRGHIQDEICKYSGAAISTRGRYMSFEDRQKGSASDRPLYLHVQASTQHAVDLAVARIHEIISQHLKSVGIVKSTTPIVSVTYPPVISNGIIPTTPVNLASPLSSGPIYVQDKVFIGLENTPAIYPVRDKVLGPGGSYLQHIKTETGANVTLRGKGSGYIEPTSGREAFEPLYIHLTHPKLEGLQAAKTLALNLVDTVHAEFVQWQQQQHLAVQSLASPTLQSPSPIGYQTIVPANMAAVSTANIPVSQTASSSVPLSAMLSSGLTLPVAATIPGIIQTSISLPVYTGTQSIASIPQVLNSSVAGIIASQAQGTVAYPATYLTSQLPAASVSAAPGLFTTPIYTPTVTSDSVVTQPTGVPIMVSQQIPVLPQSTLYTQLSSQVAASQPSVASVAPAILNTVSGLTYSDPANTTGHLPSSVYNPVTSLPTSVASAVPSPFISTIYPHLTHHQFSRIDMSAQKRKFQEGMDPNEHSNHMKLISSVSLWI